MNEQLAWFPRTSAKLYVTVVIPTGNVSPLLCDCVTVTSPKSDVAVGSGVQETTPSSSMEPTVLVIESAGQFEISGRLVTTDG